MYAMYGGCSLRLYKHVPDAPKGKHRSTKTNSDVDGISTANAHELLQALGGGGVAACGFYDPSTTPLTKLKQGGVLNRGYLDLPLLSLPAIVVIGRRKEKGSLLLVFLLGGKIVELYQHCDSIPATDS
jgi:hypothetical protein